MLSNNTIELFNKKYLELKEQTNESNEEVEFLSFLLSKYNIVDIDNIINMSAIHLILANLICTTNLNIEQLDKIEETYDEFVFAGSYTKEDRKNTTIIYVDEILHELFLTTLENIISLLEEIDKNKLLDIIYENETPTNHKFNKKIKTLKSIIKKFNIDIEFLVNICDLENKSISDTINLVKTVTSIKKLNIIYTDFVKVNKKANSKIPNSILKQAYNDKKESYDLDEINKSLNNIFNYSITLRANHKRALKNLNTELAHYEKINEWIKNNKNNSKMLKLPSSIEKIKDNELKLQLLNDIYTNNCNYYLELTQKYNNLSKNSYNNYNVLLQRYGIDMRYYNIDITKDIKTTKSMLELIKSMSISDPKSIVYILNNSTYDKVTEINNLYINKYIDADYINNNLNIFTNKYDNTIGNINLYINKKLQTKEIRKIQKSLTFDNNLISRNINILENYNLLKINDNSKNCEFLNYDKLEEKIDFILELGLEKYLKDDLSLLNRDINDYKKIILLRKINIPIDNKKMLIDILDNNNLFCNIDNIDDYLYNAPIPKNIEIEEISKIEFYNKLNNLNSSIYTFDIDGIKISKNKVERNLYNVENNILTGIDQLNIICSNIILDENELEKIVNFLKYKEKQYKI